MDMIFLTMCRLLRSTFGWLACVPNIYSSGAETGIYEMLNLTTACLVWHILSQVALIAVYNVTL